MRLLLGILGLELGLQLVDNFGQPRIDGLVDEADVVAAGEYGPDELHLPLDGGGPLLSQMDGFRVQQDVNLIRYSLKTKLDDKFR